MPMTFGSLFAGIGGLDLGLERAGMKCLWQVEIDEFCRKVLERHWPDVKRYGDVKETGKHNLAPVDLVCGGFPCQPVSVAGARRGEADERWLWPEFYRIICEVKPRWVLVENVPGFLSIDSGRLFAGVLRDLAQSGYDAEWQMLSASDFGAPHIRKRLWIIAHTNSNGWDTKGTYFDRTDDWGRLCANPQWELAQAGKGWRHLQSWVKQGFEAGMWRGYNGTICGMDDGLPAELDRLRSLGNAVVPQVAEWIGRRIIDAEETFLPRKIR